MTAGPPLPEVTPESEFFWRSGADGVLRLERCGGCGALRFPPSPRCPRCLSDQRSVVATSGRGRVAARTVNHQPWPGAPRPPYTLAIVELDDDPAVRLTTQVVGPGADAVAIGAPVVIGFEARDDVWIPVARLDGDTRDGDAR